MESRNMTEKEFEEFQKLLERELGAVDSEKEEEEKEISEMLRHEGAAHEAARTAGRSVREIAAERETADRAEAERAAALKAQRTAEAEARLKAEAEAAKAAESSAPVTRGKYEKVTESAAEPSAPKAEELLRKHGKYEKITEETEGYFNPELPKESAAERRRRARRNTQIARVAVGLAVVFVLSLGAGLIVNTVKARKQAKADDTQAASVLATDADGNPIEGTEQSAGVCNIISITPLQTYAAVLEGDTMPLQISMATSGAANAGDLLWESSDESVAEVTEDGIIKGISAGKCTITITAKADSTIGAQVDCVVRHIEEKDGATYVDGILLLNKSYGVDADYGPGDLTEETRAAFDELCSAAAVDGLNIYLASGYRSYDTQNTIYNNYTNQYGSELADTFSARPGHSEHQSGLAIDVNSIDDAFADTPEAAWLAEHCTEYGFIIRYAADKVDITGYKYEPWHIRYVGKEVAKEVTELGIALEEYLGVDSVYADNQE